MLRIALAFALAVAALGAPAKGARLPLFDAHLHYNDDAVPAHPVEDVLARFRDAGVSGILATSRPNDGTRALVTAGTRAGAPRVVPFIQPYRDHADRGTWFNDPAIYALLEAELARPIDGLATRAARFEQGRLFRVDRAGLPPSYVFGTLHSNDPRVAGTLPAEVVAALDATRTSAFETLATDFETSTFFAMARFDDARRLTDHVDPATLARIREALGQDAPDAAMLAQVKPWAILLMLAEVRDPGPLSLDAVLRAQARARSHAVTALELPDEQVASLDAIPMASQLALMRWALDTQHARRAEAEATTRAWLKGDLAGLWRLSLAPAKGDPVLAGHLKALLRHLISNRNLLFAHRLHLPLARGRVFVAVGALHLNGAEGLLALIEKQGYRITRVL